MGLLGRGSWPTIDSIQVPLQLSQKAKPVVFFSMGRPLQYGHSFQQAEAAFASCCHGF